MQNAKSTCYVYSFDQIQEVVQKVQKILQDYSIIAISGDLGVGKTTLIKKLLHNLGITDPVISPTYTYVIKYVTASGKKIYHFDLYRLTSIDEFKAAGFDEYLEEHALVIIEWPEVIMPLLKNRAYFIHIEHASDYTRRICFLPSYNL